MTLLNEDGQKIKFARDLLEEITGMDAKTKELGDQLKLEGYYSADPAFAAAYLAALNAAAVILGNEKSRLETLAEVAHTINFP